MSRGAYLSDLATFGKDAERTTKSAERYEEALAALGKKQDEIGEIFKKDAESA